MCKKHILVTNYWSYTLLKQIIHRQRILNDGFCVFILHDAVGGYHGQKNGFSGFCGLFERANFVSQIEVIRLRNFKRINGKFNFKKVNHAVFSVNNQVNLRALHLFIARLIPRTRFAVHAFDA